MSSIPRLLDGVGSSMLSWSAHEAVHGPAFERRGTELIEAAEASGLRGRGGASFPMAIKLRSVAAQRGPRSVLVNGAEGEPMSAKDRILMQLAPHLVLDGALAAAAAVDAREIVIAIRQDAADARASMRRALSERPLHRKVTVRDVPVAYLAGQETALIRYVDGGPLKPTTVPPLPFERGLRRRPTLVQNPETLAHLALIDRYGAGWFREVGTAAHPGSALVTVNGAVRRPGVLEIACGAPLQQVLDAAGGTTGELRAVLVGGYHGVWIDGADLLSTTLDDEGLGRHGGSLAAGVVVALPASACAAQELARAMRWLAAQSAHQCGPCSNGLPAIADVLEGIVAGRPAPRAREDLQRWSDDLLGRGACHLPDGSVRFLRSGLRVFAEELADHERNGPCESCRRPSTLAVPYDVQRMAA